MASRYNTTTANSSSFSSRSSTQSSSTSTDLSNPTNKKSSALKRLITGPATSRRGAQPHAPSSAIAPVRQKNEQNLTAMVKKFMAKPKKENTIGNGDKNYLVVPADFIVEDLRKVVGRKESSGFAAGLHRKLFSGGGKGSGEKTTKALTEVKANTRSLAMVLRSERELLSQCKEQEGEIEELKLIVEEKNREVEKLKDLCLKQREEIKALKSAILFPDVMNSQLQELLEKQGSELKQAKQLIPSLQEQVTSLTGQLQWLAEDLEEVKADKYSLRRRYDPHVSSPETPIYDHEDAVNSLEFSSGFHTTPGSPDDMFVKDLNPCLTPCYATAKSKELEVMSYDSPQDRFLRKHMPYSHDNGSGCHVGKLSKSSDCCCCRNSGGTSAGVAHRSDEIECTYREKMNQLFS